MSLRSLLVKSLGVPTVGLTFLLVSGCGEGTGGMNQPDEPNRGLDMPAPSKPSAAVTKGDPKSAKGGSKTATSK